MTTALVEEHGAEDLLLGMGTHWTHLRQALIEHAEGCYCGSDDWLEDHRLHIAVQEDD